MTRNTHPAAFGQVSRRSWLQQTGGMLLGWQMAQLWWENPAAAAEELAPLNRFPRMMQEFLVEQVRQAERVGMRQKNALKTKEEAEAYVKSVQERIRQSFGPHPEKTPLKPRVVGKVERDTYTIEKVIFESRPGFLVTSNLYIPKGRKFPLPGVVGSCGHSSNGKAEKAYQSFAQGLARQGYVVLIFDPIGQGERLQYPDEHLHSKVGVGVREHLLGGNQQFLVGEFFGMWRAWDGIRALDYLLTREEVDPQHVGITGNSGGGTMTTWLSGVEQRWTMSAPSCFVTTFRRNAENELPADTEQCPPRCLALGLDHDDFLAALAPKPVIILAKEKDFFDARGSEEAYARLKRLYKLLGAEDNVALFIGPTTHGYTQENREAMYRFFNKITKISDAQAEPALTLEEDKTLYCTPNGQVSELQSRPIYSYTSSLASAQAAKRKPLELAELQTSVSDVLKLPARKKTPDFRILRPTSGRQYPKKSTGFYAVETEPGIQALVYRLSDTGLVSRPPVGNKRCVLYVSHHSADVELRSEPLVADLAKAEPTADFFACDVRGIGESRPDTCGVNTFLSPYGADYFYAAHSLMLDRPYLGQKTHDLLTVLDWLSSFGYSDIHLASLAWGTLPASFAALLHSSVKQVTLKNALTSYADIASAETYDWPLSCLLPDVISRFDLPDVYRALEPKGLKLLEPRGANLKTS